FCDEFTNYNDVPVGQAAIQLLTGLGYEVVIPRHVPSGRPYLSKGLLKQAQRLAAKNIELLSPIVSADSPLLGIEPSAILTLRYEYIDLTRLTLQSKARELATNVFLIDEFLASEIDKGHITASQFKKQERLIKLHGHCHQKSLSSVVPTKKILSLPVGHTVQMIPSGCCGMAGSFGY